MADETTIMSMSMTLTLPPETRPFIFSDSIILRPSPALTTRTLGTFSSRGLTAIRTSCSSETDMSSAIAWASMDFPVPGWPTSRTLRFWDAAFLTISTAFSWPMIWSTMLGETAISAVERKLESTFSSTGFCKPACPFDFLETRFLAMLQPNR